MIKRAFAVATLLYVLTAAAASAQAVPSITASAPTGALSTPSTAIAPAVSSGSVVPQAANAAPPTSTVTIPNSGLTGWANGFFKQNGWVDDAKRFGLIIAVSALPAVFLFSMMVRPAENGYRISLGAAFGSFLGLYLGALPFLAFIANYDTFANLASSEACQLALGFASSAGDTVQTGGAASIPVWASHPAIVCSGQLTPTGVLTLAWQLMIEISSIQIPVPQQAPSGVWGWVLLPISSIANNALASGIALISMLVTGASILYVAIELVLIAVEAVIASTLSPIFLCLKYIPPLAFLARGAEMYLPNFATRLFFLLLPVGVGFTVINTERALLSSLSLSFPDLLALLGSCVFFALLTFKMKKIADTMLKGQSNLSTLNDMVKPAVTAIAELAALAVAAPELLPALGAAGAAGAGAEAGAADLGMATPVAGTGAAGRAPDLSVGALQPPRGDIVPSSAMQMEPPLALSGATDGVGSAPPGEAAAPSSSTPPPTPPPAAPSDPAPSAAPTRGANVTSGSETPASTAGTSEGGGAAPPVYGDLLPPTTPPEIGKTSDGAAVTWQLSNADELRRAAAGAAQAAAPASNAPPESAQPAAAPPGGSAGAGPGSTTGGSAPNAASANGVGPTSGPRPSAAGSSGGDAGPSVGSRASSGGSASTAGGSQGAPDSAPAGGPTSDGGAGTAPPSQEPDAIDADFRDVDEETQPLGPPKTRLDHLANGLERYLEVRSILRSTNPQAAGYAALRMLRRRQQTKQAATAAAINERDPE